MRPGRAGSLVLTSDRAVQSVQVDLGSLLETEVSIELQGSSLHGTAGPDASVVAALQIHGGWHANDRFAYHCRLWAERGLSPALRGSSRDERLLGVFMSLSALESQDPSQ